MDAARTNARFLLGALRRDDGRLLRSWQDGRARHLAYAEDYAALLEALLTLAEVDDVAWLAEARAVADDLLRLFHDAERGGFFTTGADAESLIVRPKDFQDNATPSENSLAANGLLRLAAFTGEPEYETVGAEIVGLLAGVTADHPTSFAYLLGALERVVTPPLEVAVVGDGDAAAALRREVVGPPAAGGGGRHRVSGCGNGADSAARRARPRRRAADGVRLRALRVPPPGHDPADLRAQLDAALAGRR